MAGIDFTIESIQREYFKTAAASARSLGTLRAIADARVGATPRKLVHEVDKVKVYRYSGEHSFVAQRVPLLIVYALVNRPEMADLEKGRSMVEGLLSRGFDVYLVDWGYPDSADEAIGIEQYVAGYLDDCVNHVLDLCGEASLTLLGICQGGTFSVLYSALNPGKVRRLITTVTPIDFHTKDDLISHLVRYVDIDLMIDTLGNVDGDILNGFFLSLKPFRLTLQKYVNFFREIDDHEKAATFYRMEQWIFDSPSLTARSAREFAKCFYQENQLARNSYSLGSKKIDLKNITMPVLNIFAREDHLVPPDSSRALRHIIGSRDYIEHELPGGHIGIYVGSRSGGSVPEIVAQWVSERN